MFRWFLARKKNWIRRLDEVSKKTNRKVFVVIFQLFFFSFKQKTLFDFDAIGLVISAVCLRMNCQSSFTLFSIPRGSRALRTIEKNSLWYKISIDWLCCQSVVYQKSWIIFFLFSPKSQLDKWNWSDKNLRLFIFPVNFFFSTQHPIFLRYHLKREGEVVIN